MDRKYYVKEGFMISDQATRPRRDDLGRSVSRPRLGRQFEGQRPNYSTPRDLSLRCSAERSMPMNSAVRDMLPPNRLI
jgi:hypothetical protein